MLATVVTGLYWLAERAYFLPGRRRAADQAEQDVQRRQEELARQGIARNDLGFDEATRQRMLAQPWWLDWTAGLFPVILAVFVLRSFLFEPFKIPSGSMIPTLHVGDLILVNKFHYGVRLPVFNTKVIANNEPQRGDVMVFRYPPQPSLDYIKRVIGVPGDEVAYLNKRLTVNGQPVLPPTSPISSMASRCATPSSSERIWRAALQHAQRRHAPSPSSPGFQTSPTVRIAAIRPRAWCAKYHRGTIS
jgi:signal peptidase I